MKKTLLALALVSSASSFAQISPLENYTPTSINQNMVGTVWDSMKTSFDSGSECFNRAITWTYDIDKQFGIKSKRILIHYSYKFNKELSSKWGFHTAPIINVEGKDVVFDKGFTPWLHSPVSKQMWEEKFLIAGTKELVDKRIDLAEDLRDEMQDLRELDRSSDYYASSYQRTAKKIREIKEEMKYFNVTDADLKKQKPVKIAQLKKSIKFHKAKLKEFRSGSDNYYSVKSQLKYDEDLLQKVMTDLDYAAHIQCKKINHIEELDFNLTKEWCYIQETSMYYWGVPQLRLLNYGQYDRPYESELASKRRNGAEYVQNDFSMEQIWIARKQAYGRDYKDLWKREYEAKERAEDRAKEERREARRDAREQRREERRRDRERRRRERNND